jgi:hypothetical protein
MRAMVRMILSSNDSGRCQLVAFPKAQKMHERVWIALSGQIPDQFIVPESFGEGFLNTNA